MGLLRVWSMVDSTPPSCRGLFGGDNVVSIGSGMGIRRRPT